MVKKIENVLAIAPMLQEEVSILLRQAKEISDALPDTRDDIEPPKTRAVKVSAASTNAGQGARRYDTEGAAKLCGIRVSTLTRMCREGHGPEAEPRPSREPYSFRRASLVWWLSQHYIAPDGIDMPALGKRLLSQTQAAKLRGCSYSQMQWLMASGIMPYLKINGRVFLFKMDAEADYTHARC